MGTTKGKDRRVYNEKGRQRKRVEWQSGTGQKWRRAWCGKAYRYMSLCRDNSSAQDMSVMWWWRGGFEWSRQYTGRDG
jgi:hypothetical protein